MVDHDLGVLDSTAYVVERARFVALDEAALAAVAARLAGSPLRLPAWNEAYHFRDGTARTANYILVLDALNFCFWGEPRWRVEYRGETLDGYWALAAALKRAVEEGVPVLDAGYLARLSASQLAHILRGEAAIPLFEARLGHLREVGRVLGAKYEGQFARAVEAAGRGAVRLVQQIVRDFSSFDDVARYEGREVRFYKRAQICVADLYGAFGGRQWGAFDDLDRLTAFADYKVPQMLRELGILKYAPALGERIDAGTLIPAGSQEEIEIRAATIWGVERLRRALAAAGRTLRAFEVDWYLWDLSQQQQPAVMRPYHRTRTVFY